MNTTKVKVNVPDGEMSRFQSDLRIGILRLRHGFSTREIYGLKAKFGFRAYLTAENDCRRIAAEVKG